jgi:putative PEP-CTERM system integral membrane protein
MTTLTRTWLDHRVGVSLRGAAPFVGGAVFWSWNLVFMAFALFGGVPFLLVPLVSAVRDGFVTTDIAVAIVALFLIPTLSIVLALTVLRRQPAALLGLFYGIEAPLLLGALIRLFFLKQLNPGVVVLVTVAGVGMLTFIWQQAQARGTTAGHARAGSRTDVAILVGTTCSAIFGVWLAAWIMFYAAPVALVIGSGLRDVAGAIFDLRHETIGMAAFLVTAGAVGLVTGTLIVIGPPAALYIHALSWWNAFSAVARRPGSGLKFAVAVTAATTAAVSIALAFAGRQPQSLAFAALAPMEERILAPDAAAADFARVDLRGLEDEIRSGLLNAYLAPYRYLGAHGSNNHIEAMYVRELAASPEMGERLQQAYNLVISPILYRGDTLDGDQTRASTLYRAVFDVPLQEAERDSVADAVTSTWVFDEAEAGLLDVGKQHVHLERQEIMITDSGDWASVEIHDVYRNLTHLRQEVFLYFSLPESAALTGIWLGTSDDKTQSLAYQVAPRGAAQEVYKAQVRRAVDPALLEQIGPAQYRLRVFPIEPRSREWNNDRADFADTGPAMHMWLTYATFVAAGAWPLPSVAETRNLFWDEHTVRVLNGAALLETVSDWTVPSVQATSVVAASHVVYLEDGSVVSIAPTSGEGRATDEAPLRLAVVVDRSASMRRVSDEVAAAIVALSERGHRGDVFLTSPTLHPNDPEVLPLDVATARLRTNGGLQPSEEDSALAMFGGHSPQGVVEQFLSLRAPSASYDAVLVLTDDGAFTADDDVATLEEPAPRLVEPLWFVHLGSRFPPGYDDATLEAMQASGGGAAGSLDEALQRLIARAAGITVGDGYEWEFSSDEAIGSDEGGLIPDELSTDRVAADGVVANEPASAETGVDDGSTIEPGGLAAIAARHAIERRVRGFAGAPPAVSDLDAIHQLAVEYAVVTPYSSMIVLVNDWQRQALDDASTRADRFDREVETGEEEISAGDPMAVTPVPEPEEWLLILLGVALLAKMVWERGDLVRPVITDRSLANR